MNHLNHYNQCITLPVVGDWLPPRLRGALAVEPSSCLTSPYVGVGGPTIARSRSTPQGVHRAPAVAPYRRLHGTMCVKPSCLGCIDRSVPCMLASRDSVWPSEPLSIPNVATCLPSHVLTPLHATLVWLIALFYMHGRRERMRREMSYA